MVNFSFARIGLKIGDEIIHAQTNEKYISGCTGRGTLIQSRDDGGLISIRALTNRLSSADNSDYLTQWTYRNVSLADLFKERKRKNHFFENAIDAYRERQWFKKARKTKTIPYEICFVSGNDEREESDELDDVLKPYGK